MPGNHPMNASGSVVTDGFDRTTRHRFFTELFFFGRAWLFVNVGIATLIAPGKIGWGCFTAQVAVDALTVDVILA